jgi:hypothetical protein
MLGAIGSPSVKQMRRGDPSKRSASAVGGQRPVAAVRRLAGPSSVADAGSRLRNGLAAVILVVSLGLACPGVAEAPDRWRPYTQVDIGVLDNIKLRVHWYENSAALREAAEKAKDANIKEIGLHAFTQLSRITETGEYVCDVHVLKMVGTFVDNDRTMSFGHEILHCLGLSHE